MVDLWFRNDADYSRLLIVGPQLLILPAEMTAVANRVYTNSCSYLIKATFGSTVWLKTMFTSFSWVKTRKKCYCIILCVLFDRYIHRVVLKAEKSASSKSDWKRLFLYSSLVQISPCSRKCEIRCFAFAYSYYNQTLCFTLTLQERWLLGLTLITVSL